MGDNIEHVISYWLLYQKFHSPVLAGFAVISHWTPFLLFAVYFGALADRHDCRRVIQTRPSDVCLGLAHLGNSFSHRHHRGLACLCAAGAARFVRGVGLDGSQLIIHDIVGREHLQSAVRLNSTGREYRDPDRSGGWAERPCLCSAVRLGLFINVLYVSAGDRLHVEYYPTPATAAMIQVRRKPAG